MASRISLLVIVLWCSLVAITTATTGPYKVHNITRFHNLKFENLSPRFNGEILATISAPAAMLYLVDPLLIRPPTLIHSFADVEHITGIYELSPDMFYVAGGNWTITNSTQRFPESLGLYEVDMHPFFAWPNGTVGRQAAIRKSDFVLIADTFVGVIWHVNIPTGNVQVALNDSTLSGNSSNPTGVNGIKIFNSTLYYTNTGQAALYRVPITATGRVSGKPTMVTDDLPCDDLILDAEGNAFVAGPANVIMKVTPSGEKSIVAGTYDSSVSALVGATAVAFGRLATDWMSLYITTNGGAGQSSINGTQGVSRIDVFDLPSR